MVSGGKLNPIMSLAFLKLTFQEMHSIYKARKEINKVYDRVGLKEASE